MIKLSLLFSLLISVSLFGQQKQVYDEKADAAADIAAAVTKAKAENKHVFLQIGGNWCGWCIKFNRFAMENDTIKTAFDKNYVVVHVNYSSENKNEKLMSDLGYPQRFGFPVFVILDSDGKRIHTQNTVYLEEGKGYNSKEVIGFLEAWKPAALDPKMYR